MKRRLQFVSFALIVTALLLAACQPAATPAPTQAPAAVEQPTSAPAEPTAAPVEPTAEPAPVESSILPEVDPAALSGTIYAAGSSTVYPLSEAVAEQFKADGFAGEIKIDSIGSGAGFERFCKTGESDISNASRGIKDGEVEN